MSHGAPAPGSVLQRSSSSEGNAQSHEDNERKVRRREKNRVAAQRSRKKQTQKADNLHKEYECLEQENTSLKREIGKLTDEMKHLSEVLRDHEKSPDIELSANLTSFRSQGATFGKKKKTLGRSSMELLHPI